MNNITVVEHSNYIIRPTIKCSEFVRYEIIRDNLEKSMCRVIH